MICGRTPEELIHDIEKFHGFVAPGLLIGSYMVDLAFHFLGKDMEFGAIVETEYGLPDAVQLFTPCTIGNGRLHIQNLGKFALTLYDRCSFNGCRVFLDLPKTEKFPLIYRWFMGSEFQNKQSYDPLVRDIITAGFGILSHNPVKVLRPKERRKKQEIAVCGQCREAYRAKQGDLCITCQGKGYYEIPRNA